jgi:hypothetical protein
LVLGAWLGAAPAWAANGITAIEVRTYPNLTSVAVQAVVQGDDDSSAVLRIFQRRVGAAAFDTGMVMVRRLGFGPTTNDPRADNARAGNVYEGRILWLDAGDRVEFYVEGRDAGGDMTTRPSIVAPAKIRPLDASGPVFYVNAGAGDDRNDGRKARPKRTLGAALDALAAAPDHGRHGGVFLAPGEYHERIEFDAKRFPDDGGPWFIEGDGTDRDSTIICGADPRVERGFYAPGKPIRWTFTGQDSTWACYLPGGTGPGDSTQLVVLGWGELLHRKTSIKAVLDDSTFAYRSESPGGVGDGELSGWWWQHDTLYVKRANGESPEGSVLHLGHLDRLFDIQRRNVRIANLTFRFAGGLEDTHGRYRAAVDPGLNGNGIAAGLRGTASGIVIDSCRFYGFNAPAVYIVHGAGGFVADSAVVAHCTIDGLRLGDWRYGACKSRSEEVAGQVFFRTRGGSFVDNVVTDTFNGIGADTSPDDSTVASACEIARCTFRHITDDAIELDSSHCLNLLVAADTIEDCGDGISIAPLWDGGPLFAFFNVIDRARYRGIKGGGGSVGLARFAHNTIVTAPTAVAAVDFSPGGAHDGTWFADNVLAGTGRAGAIRGPAEGGTETNAFDFDLLASGDERMLASWHRVSLTLGALRTSLGWERNGAVLDAAAAAAAARGLAASPVLGVGCRLTGIDTGLDGNRYAGKAPSIGAIQQRAP